MRTRGAALTLSALLLAGCGAEPTGHMTPFSLGRPVHAVVEGIPPAVDVTAMQFLSGRIGFAAAQFLGWSNSSSASGALGWGLLETQDGGQQWSRHSVPPISVTGMDFLDAQDGFLVGKTKRSADLFVTTDAGRTWALRLRVALSVKRYRQTLDAVHFFNLDSGYALLDGALYRTADAGLRWQHVALPTTANDAVFQTPELGLAVGDRSIYRTSDAGALWTREWTLPKALYLPGTYYATPAQLAVNYGLATNLPGGINLVASRGQEAYALFNEGTYCAMPHCAVYVVRSLDGGRTWRAVAAGSFNVTPAGLAQGPLPVASEILPTAGGIYVVGMSDLQLTRSTGGGAFKNIWYYLTDRPSSVTAVSAAPNGPLWMASGGTLLQSTDWGGHWHTVWPAPEPTGGVQFVNGRVGYGLGSASGSPALLATASGGGRWRVAHLFPGLSIRAFAFTAQGVGYVVGTEFLPGGRRIVGEVLRTADGGRIWSTVYEIGDASAWLAHVTLRVTSPLDAVLVAQSVLETTDGGRTWRKTGAPPGQNQYFNWSTAFATMRDGIAVYGETGLVYRTQDGGRSWRQVGRIAKHRFTAVNFASSTLGWISLGRFGDKLTLLVTEDGGARWSQYTFPATQALLSGGLFSFPSLHIGYMDSQSGLYRTTDGGKMWRQVP